MTIITASEAVTATVSAQTPDAEDLDAKYALFNTVVKNAVAAGSWTTRMSVAVSNADQFKAWANTLGYVILIDPSNESLATNIDGLTGETLARFLVSWRKIDTFTLRDRVSIHEGDQLAFDIVTQGYLPGDTIYWTNTGTTNAQDYGIGPAMARPQGSWLTVKSAEQWAESNSAMRRLLVLLTRAQGNQPLVARYTRQVAQLKLKLEYEAGLEQQVYNDAVSQYEGELAIASVTDALGQNTVIKAVINLLVFRDKGIEAATGQTESNETLIIKLWADSACTQLLYTSPSYTVVNEV